MGWQVALGFFVSLFLTCAVASASDCHPGKASEDERLTEFLALPHDFDYAEGNFETLVGQVVE